MSAETSAAFSVGQPFHFGDPARPLFGLYHEPRAAARRDVGVVLCYPMAEEYIRAHRSFRQLAFQLATAGLPVLRFDYHGCGDSSGAREDGHVGQWLRDIAVAVAELRTRANVTSVCLVGLRLGGALAMLAAAERNDVASLVLWDPVFDGKVYLRDMAAADAAQPQPTGQRRDPPRSISELTEVQGFPLTPQLRAELLGLRLIDVMRRPAPTVFLVDSQTSDAAMSLKQHLEGLGSRVDFERIPALAFWIEDNKALVPAAILQAIVGRLSASRSGLRSGDVREPRTGS